MIVNLAAFPLSSLARNQTCPHESSCSYSHNGDALAGSNTARLPPGMGVPGSLYLLLLLGSYVHPLPLTGTHAITGTLGVHRRKCIEGDILSFNVCPQVIHYVAPKNELKDA